MYSNLEKTFQIEMEPFKSLPSPDIKLSNDIIRNGNENDIIWIAFEICIDCINSELQIYKHRCAFLS